MLPKTRSGSFGTVLKCRWRRRSKSTGVSRPAACANEAFITVGAREGVDESTVGAREAARERDNESTGNRAGDPPPRLGLQGRLKQQIGTLRRKNEGERAKERKCERAEGQMKERAKEGDERVPPLRTRV